MNTEGQSDETSEKLDPLPAAGRGAAGRLHGEGSRGADRDARGGADVGAIKTAISLVEKGELVNIFPQGTRYVRRDPSETKVKSGAGMIAYHAKCGAIPVFIKTKNNHLHLFGKNEIIIGKPIEYEEFGFEAGGMKEYVGATEKIFSRALALGGLEYPKGCAEGKNE